MATIKKITLNNSSGSPSTYPIGVVANNILVEEGSTKTLPEALDENFEAVEQAIAAKGDPLKYTIDGDDDKYSTIQNATETKTVTISGTSYSITKNVASGVLSHTEGNKTTASGNYSHAEGSGTTASGNYSHSQNRSTIAQGQDQTTIGKFNVAQGSKSSAASTDQAFIIGNGTSSSARSNAFSIQWDGTMSQDNGATKFKFTKDSNNSKGYIDETGTFNAIPKIIVTTTDPGEGAAIDPNTLLIVV